MISQTADFGADSGPIIGPGGTLGILGGGQLARMIALAAADYGIRTHIFAPEADSPAFEVAGQHTCAAYEDEAALAAFAAKVGAVTYEFEDVPAATAAFLSARRPVRPGAHALSQTQDRLTEKTMLRAAGCQTADFAKVDTLADLEAAIANIGLPAVLKTRRLGYDGKGQAKIMATGDVGAAFAAMRGAPAILEAFVPFSAEVSVVAARGLDGAFAAFPVTENEHRNHILYRSTVPANITTATEERALADARRIGEALGYIGVFAVEFFVVPADGEVLLVNEIAPRVHNSGHWTSEGAETSQFHQHVRAVCGLPLGSTQALGKAMMQNLIGDEAANWSAILAEPGARLHLYGKHEAREGRKMGHVTWVEPKTR
ncbi:MAG: 5-(carboxyamino)imidazole ribonucleotide synthase [Bosea sp. (in: a-proteobacteria)]